jgi:hypothetical protein
VVGKSHPQGLDYPDTAPYRVTASHECAAPASAVFDVLRDNPAGVRWMGWYITSVRSTSDPEGGVGSTRDVHWLGGIGKLEERFIGWEEDTLWSFTTTAFRPGILAKFVERIRLESIDDDNCRIVYDAGFEMSRIGRPVGRLLTAFVNSQLRPTLRRLGDTAIEGNRAPGSR